MFTGDPRMTNIITEDAKKLMDALESSEEQSSNTIIHLAPLPAPLADLNARTLQSVLTAVIKDLGVNWNGDFPTWWPEDIPFCKPRTVPSSHKGRHAYGDTVD